MEYYTSSASAAPETNYRRLGLFVFVLVLHGLLFWALQSGLAKTLVRKITGPMETKIIEEVKVEEEAPPPPPPKFQAPPPVFVDMPNVAITEAPTTNAVTATNAPARAAPPPPKADVVIAPRQNPRRPNVGADEMYPAMSKRLGEEGTVVLLLTVDEDGKVSDGSIQSSSGFERLDEAALKEAKRSWRFLPGTVNGKPASMQMPMKVTFKIPK